MYNNPYYNTYNQQTNIDKLNEQINNLEKMKAQLQQPQPTNLTQNFQLAPASRDVIRYASSIDEVQRDMTMGETPYFSKDMSVVWIKNAKGEIKTYELTEIIPQTESDFQIQLLQNELEQLKKEMKKYEQNTRNVISTENSTNSAKYDETTREPIKDDESSSVQRVSTGKKRQ